MNTVTAATVSFSSLLPLSLPLRPIILSHYQAHVFTPNTILHPKLYSFSSSPVVVVRSSNEPSKEAAVGAFLDENGVVEDMDGYLNQLSLEYDSVWDTKPSWCQPWTIVLTGVVAVAFSWLILKSVVVTSLVSSLICAWWYIFLYSYPKAYSDMIADRRKNITDGVEDTFGSTKPR